MVLISGYRGSQPAGDVGVGVERHDFDSVNTGRQDVCHFVRPC